MSMKRLLMILLFLTACASAQVTYSVLIPANPPGGAGASCSTTAVAYLAPSGTIYTCQSGTWQSAGGGSATSITINSTTVTGGTPGDLLGVASGPVLTQNTLAGWGIAATGVDINTSNQVTGINGTAFSGTNGHLVSFGASNTPADSGIVAANVLTGLTINGTTISGGGTNAVLYGDGTKLQNAAGVTRTGTGQFTFTQTALGTTPSDAIELVNTTAAATGAQQISPSLHWEGQGWKTTSTAASQAVDFRMQLLPVQGTANPTFLFKFDQSVNGGAYSTMGSIESSNTSNNGGALTFDSIGGGCIAYTGGFCSAVINGGSVTVGYTIPLGWVTNGGDPAVNARTSAFSQISAGLIGVGTGANGSFAGNLKLTPGATVTSDVNVCWQPTNSVFTEGSVCGTSLAIYKQNVESMTHGLDYVMQFRPVTFDWKQDGRHDLGMIADEVAAIDPLMGAYRADGSLYNFKDRAVLATLVKAVQDIERQVQYLQRRAQ